MLKDSCARNKLIFKIYRQHILIYTDVSSSLGIWFVLSWFTRLWVYGSKSVREIMWYLGSHCGDGWLGAKVKWLPQQWLTGTGGWLAENWAALIIFKCVVMITCMSISSVIASRWMAQDPTDDKSTLVQVMACCHQATSHYLNQCWLRSMLPYGVTGSQP